MGKMRLKKGDRVRVITGKYAGVEGKILRRDTDRDMIVVEGVNMATKHVRPSKKNPKSGIIKQEAPFYACKAMLVCPACGKATRVGHAYLDNGKKVRLCRQCGEVVDKV